MTSAIFLLTLAAERVDFLHDVQPLLAQKCFSCHGAGSQQAGLRLDRRQAAMRGGDYGPVIIPGNSAASKLVKRVINGDGGVQMPPTGALSAEEIDVLKRWIDQGADYVLDVKEDAPPKPVDPQVMSLISAVRAGRTPTVPRELVNASDASGNTLLHHVAAFGSLDAMKSLLDQGADPNALNLRKSTPLMWALRDEAKVRMLLARGADVNPRQADGRTALYLASLLGQGGAIVKTLLARGADANLAAATGQTPLMAAASRGNLEVVELLLTQKQDVNRRAGNGGTALILAAGSGNAKVVSRLLTAGANPNLYTKRKDSALGEAATAGVEEAVRLLLDAGAEVNVPDDRGYSPLMYAAASDAIPVGIVRALLAKGADPNQTGEGETARTLAAKRGNTEITRLLTPPAQTISEAVEKASKLLAKQSENFIRIGGCNSCHAQDLTSAAAALARDRGLRAPKVVAQLGDAQRGASADRLMELNVIGVSGLAWELFDLGMNRLPRSEYTDAAVHYMKATQRADGSWFSTESRRPPMSSGAYQAAALVIYSLKHYSDDSAAEIARAAAWLEKQQPVNTQDRAFQLLGLRWANASAAAIDRVAKGLVAIQRPDGSWSQMPTMDSDSYATGQALYALSADTKSSAFQKGIDYLLRTQAKDGSWHVKSRSIWIQPYFESGFPYGHDQWISVAGTAWATMALSAAYEAPALSQR